jgi:hypothetical protein
MAEAERRDGFPLNLRKPYLTSARECFDKFPRFDEEERQGIQKKPIRRNRNTGIACGKKPRRSGVAIESVQTPLKEGPLKEKDLNVSIANLLKLHKAGSSRFMCCWRCRTKASRAITPPTARTIARNRVSI